MKKMLAIMLAVVILLASAFYFFYIKGNDTPIIDEAIDYEEQLGGKLAKEKTDLTYLWKEFTDLKHFAKQMVGG